MKTVKVNKDDLLEKLVANQETHQKDFELAWDGFRIKAMDNVTAMLDTLKQAISPQQVNLWVNLEAPENHSEDYVRAIEMLAWEVGDEVVLSEAEFRQYVQDLWGWTHAVSMSNIAYTGHEHPSQL